MGSLVPNFDRSLPTTCPIDIGTSPDEEAAKWGSKPKAAMLAASAARRARMARLIAAEVVKLLEAPPVAVPVDLETFVDPVRPAKPPLLIIRMIQHECAREWGITLNDLLSHRRTKSAAKWGSDIVTPRHVAIYLAKEMTLYSLPRIAMLFSGRDHSTILYAARKISRLIIEDEVLRERVDRVRVRVTGSESSLPDPSRSDAAA